MHGSSGKIVLIREQAELPDRQERCKTLGIGAVATTSSSSTPIGAIHTDPSLHGTCWPALVRTMESVLATAYPDGDLYGVLFRGANSARRLLAELGGDHRPTSAR